MESIMHLHFIRYASERLFQNMKIFKQIFLNKIWKQAHFELQIYNTYLTHATLKFLEIYVKMQLWMFCFLYLSSSNLKQFEASFNFHVIELLYSNEKFTVNPWKHKGSPLCDLKISYFIDLAIFHGSFIACQSCFLLCLLFKFITQR